MRLKAEMIFLNIAKGTTDPSVEFSLAKVTFLGHINFKISTEHQILMSTDCPDDMLSENITKDTMSSLQQGGRSCAGARVAPAEKFGLRRILSPNIRYFVAN